MLCIPLYKLGDQNVMCTDIYIGRSKSHFISLTFDCQLSFTEVLTIRSSVHSTTDTIHRAGQLVTSRVGQMVKKRQ